MADLICDSCGERNPAGTEFCTSCNAYLAWDRTRTFQPSAPATPQPPPAPPRPPTGPVAAPRGPVPAPRGPVVPRGPVPDGATVVVGQQPAVDTSRPEPLRAVSDLAELTLIPGGESGALTITVFNASRIVDRYLAEIPGGPPWLALTAEELRLAPQADGTLHVTLRIPAPPLVAAGRHALTVRVRSATDPQAVVALPLELTVGVVDAPIGLRLEPQLLRVKDSEGGSGRVLLDNRSSNHPVRVTLIGSDPEGALRFDFRPPAVVLPAMGTADVLLSVSGPPPAAGKEASRQFTVTATGGTREAVAAGSLTQSTSAQGLSLAAEPARQTVTDTGGADFRLTVQHSGGRRPVRVALRATDPERLARVTFSPPVVDLAAGGSASVRMHVELPLPEAGQEITREITASATAGDATESTKVSVTIRRSPDALQLRLEPSVVKVRDTPYGRTRLIADNRQGVRPVRATLAGSDPELAIGFRFSPPVLEVAAGQVASVTVDMSASLPEQGAEASRPFTVRVAAGERATEVPGTFAVAASEPAIADLVIRMEPPVHRVQGRQSGSALVVADNRSGTAPAEIFWQGADSEGVVRFWFDPPSLVVPPGGTAASRVTMAAPAPGREGEKIRSIVITGSDGLHSVDTTGSLVQTGADRRPLWGILLTVLGAALMIVGVLLPWVTSPERHTGLELSLIELARLTDIDLTRLNFNLEALRQIPRQLISAGIVVLLFAAVQLFGLTGKTGRLIRTGAGLSFVFVVALVLALVFRAGSWTPGAGLFLVVAGAIAGFAGGLLARR